MFCFCWKDQTSRDWRDDLDCGQKWGREDQLQRVQVRRSGAEPVFFVSGAGAESLRRLRLRVHFHPKKIKRNFKKYLNIVNLQLILLTKFPLPVQYSTGLGWSQPAENRAFLRWLSITVWKNPKCPFYTRSRSWSQGQIPESIGTKPAPQY